MIEGTELDSTARMKYQIGMKNNTKSSITLPPAELKLVVSLKARLKAKSKVEVVRRGLRMLEDATDRERLREAYRRASAATRASLSVDLAELDGLASEGLDGA
jgi:Arc/MetJ-type ribon-helix-helix transcriptional regulator